MGVMGTGGSGGGSLADYLVSRGTYLRQSYFPPWYALIPCVMQASGGIIVGQVTQHVGGVAKGFAIIAGIVVTASLKYILLLQADGVANLNMPKLYANLTAIALVSLSIYLQATAQMKAKPKLAPEKKTQ